MAGLKADLDNYLSGTNNKSSTFTNLTKNLSMPSFKSPFSNKEDGKNDDEEALLSDSENAASSGSNNYWFSEATNRWLPTLSKKQRIFGFVTSLGLGLFFFSMATVYIPVLLLKARKFSLLFSLGSLFTMGSFSFLWGPWSHLQHLFGKERLPFTSIYFGSLVATLYFALSLQSTILTSVAAVCQVVALVWFVVSYIPGGQTGMKFFGRICSTMCKKGSGNVLPL